ncbi:nucleotidyl transferase AbiEii/AbiGii toxin family protein [Pyxidicoccus parkwayensis]|uniref:Nucleotidyl transferase AbiEii/AbiGii toxin family protein n=1 Tax=Pyxidicoccus parkwayensis TaxID=2813578 RepID=A0ABX7NS79_9BACT|nr:nucleotidyl transferase AbiEii/AbiGii toxin family protein [Pyxidicoccus parkwaysis]QSQ21558.1 nucleotidyl transferase AbiEii/AbiGii toxin family protein [Pyxidicoccus parkwaysis]
MTARGYASAFAFKQALEQRLRSASRDGEDFIRRRQRLVFERFLARVGHIFGDAVTLKGGLVLELRIASARATRDVDLRLTDAPEGLHSRLQTAGQLELGDFMQFEVRPDANHPELQNEGMKHEGFRFRAECQLAEKLYGDVFGVDVVLEDRRLEEPEFIVAPDVLGFAGVSPPRVRLYPVEAHIAEKLHAYTLPRSRPNTRVKDLPDLALLASVGVLEANRIRTALSQTFGVRETHAIPAATPSPPNAWLEPYATLAARDRLAWRTLEEVTTVVRAFLDPVLAGEQELLWEPGSWSWRARN